MGRAAAVIATAALGGCGAGAQAPADVDSADAGAVERPAPPAPSAPYARPAYQRLSDTGLFTDVGVNTTVDAEARAFEPAYKLWSDGAVKRRWIRLPPGTQIDSSDMDHWQFPVGTKLWKEFSLEGVKLETRLVERYGTGAEDYWMGAFVWSADQTDAVFAVDGQSNINGTSHDAPSQKNCGLCHRGEVGRALGFSAIQLSGASGDATLRTLNALNLLTRPADEAGYPAPGEADTAQTLGYLHANCGHCHNKNGSAWPDTQMVLRLGVGERDLLTSEIYVSTVNKRLQYWRGGPIELRVATGRPDASALVARMATRGSEDQMPPLATEVIDPAGVERVRRWISSLAE